MEPIAKPYREMLQANGTSPVANYSGDLSNRVLVDRLLQQAGSGGVVNEDAPRLPIPGRVLEIPTAEVMPNTAAINPVDPGAASAAAGLSLKGAVQWVKDNPVKAVAIGVAGYLVLNEMFGKKKRK